MSGTPPPCWEKGKPLNACARELYARQVDASFPLDGQWRGWRIVGGALVGPGGVRWIPQTLLAAAGYQELGREGSADVQRLLSRVSQQ